MQEMLKISVKSFQVILGLWKTRKGKPGARKELLIETTVINLMRRKFGKGAQFFFADQSQINQRIPIDEIRVSGIRGKNLVRGVAVSSWTNRASLPKADSRFGQKIYEGTSGGSEVANAIRTGKGREMKKASCRSLRNPRGKR